MNKLKIILASIATAALMLVPIAAMAEGIQIGQNLCDGSNNTSSGANCDAAASKGQVQSLVTTVINIFSWVVGLISVIMIIYGGFKYVTSAGGSGVEDAKKVILYAIIGLVVVAFAQVIVHFVLGSISNSANGS